MELSTAREAGRPAKSKDEGAEEAALEGHTDETAPPPEAPVEAAIKQIYADAAHAYTSHAEVPFRV